MRTENKSVAGTRELCQCAHQATSPTDTTVSARHHERIRDLHPSPRMPGTGSDSAAHRVTWVEAVFVSRLSAALVKPGFPHARSPDTSVLLGASFHTQFRV